MDTAVALVKTYLQANGFFTVTEYPILEILGDGAARTVTDIDILALRFPGAGGFGTTAPTTGMRIAPDPDLGIDDQVIEAIIGEVKEGSADLNKAARDPDVLRAVLRRFGAMEPEVADSLVEDLVRTGTAHHPAGIRVRLMVFASKPPSRRKFRYSWLSHAEIGTWLQDQVRENWDRVKTVQSKDAALGFLILFEKARRGEL
jgi:hypothetical protein